ncbi:MAG: tannase/feruloyl esterase family alpha/beta hydrolase, partial [Bacteroidales bacterium]
ELEEYIRLYMLPGVLHCGGGPGPGQADWLDLVRDWAENGNAPERVIVSKMKGGEAVMTRPVFPYPGTAIYDGAGDPNTERSFNEKKK